MQVPADHMLEAMPLPALIIRRDERIGAANAPARALLGREIVERHFITALRQPDLLDAIEGCLRDGTARRTDFLSLNARQEMTYRVLVVPLPLASGTGVVVSFEDVSHLEQTVQMRRDFVANVSHELRTPLTALIGFIETIKGPARNDPAGQARFLDIMEGEAQRMVRLVADLLSLSRVEAEERVRPSDPVDLGDLVRATLHGLTTIASDAGVTLVQELPDEPVRVPGDPDQLRQVLTNLVENGIKYAGGDASVIVWLSAPDYEPRLRGRGVRLVVADTGQGIDAIHLPRLTERFYRVDSHRSRQQGGTGLGLAIVKHIVNRHRGRLRVDSTRGEGTTVTILLPLE
ncbi:hypothetical protein JYP51_17550 [Ponticoccus gilvus]|nr:hypothetical protein [Enemella evansiae]